MLSLKDCMDFCDLTEVECLAIMNQANVSSIAACALSQEIKAIDNSQAMRNYLRLYIDCLEKQQASANTPAWQNNFTNSYTDYLRG